MAMTPLEKLHRKERRAMDKLIQLAGDRRKAYLAHERQLKVCVKLQTELAALKKETK